jgi:choloylglycine hydrolase
MRLALRLLPAVLAAVAWAAPRAAACTTFLLVSDDGRVVGKCYDWHMGQALVLVNKRGVDKRALPLGPDERPATWRSEHASVTFNQYGREVPNGGMNDAGLVVEVMWLDATVLPPPDARPTVNELQWIQYQLDRWASTAEVVAHAGELRVARANGLVHYLVCDRGGDCAALEFLDGRLVVSRGGELVTPVLTNDTHADSVAWLRQFRGFGGKRPIPTGAGSLERFVRTAARVQAPAHGDLRTAAFGVLDDVNNAASRWHIVYDPTHLTVAWRTRAERKIKRVDLSRIPPGCGSPVEMLDIDAAAEGEVTARFTPYREEANARLVERSLKSVQGLPPGTGARLAHYPELLRCSAP